MGGPKAKMIASDKSLGGDYSVCHGQPSFVATCPLDAKPAFVSVHYHGYSRNHY